eukprot:3556102-Amphidinium_carterae.1
MKEDVPSLPPILFCLLAHLAVVVPVSCATSKAKGVDYETALKWTTRMKAQLSKSPEAMEKWGTLCSLPGRGAQKN